MELRVLREHRMPQPQGGTERRQSRSEGQRIDYILCNLPEGTAKNTLGAAFWRVALGAEGRQCWGRKESRGNQAPLGCVRARGGLEGKRK